MASYAALVSLMQLMDDIQHHHSPPISLHKHQIQSLTEYVIFLQEFLQGYKSPVSYGDEADPLEMRIADAAYAAEDVIESHIVDKIQLARSKQTKTRRFFNWFRGLKGFESHIIVSTLIKLWVSEGFLKPVDGKSLETIGKGFLRDLVDRNLVLVDEFGSTGNIKRVKVHDLLRNVCLDQGKKERFYHVIEKSSPPSISSHRRFVIRRNTSIVYDDLQSMSHARSVICEQGYVPWCPNFGLLRTIHAYKFRSLREEKFVNIQNWRPNMDRISRCVNSRHLAVEVAGMSTIFSSFNHVWNLQTLIVSCQFKSTAPTKIWKMPQLRHVHMMGGLVGLVLPDPSSDAVVMENLVVLKGAFNFKCDEEVVKRIPNIKKLRIIYSGAKRKGHDDYYCVSNIKHLSKLESLHITCFHDFRGIGSWYNFRGNVSKLTFPQTIKSLSLEMNGDFEWETILETIGSLPLLEKFLLWSGCFRIGTWEIFEGQFICLKLLELHSCHSLKHWTTEASSIFPRLEKLFLHLEGLENIPSEIGDIPTLKQILMVDCSETVVRCVKEILEEQRDLQGDDLPFEVQVGYLNNTPKLSIGDFGRFKL